MILISFDMVLENVLGCTPILQRVFGLKQVHGVPIHGIDVDENTRCAHWHSAVDIIAIRMKCCDRWVGCFDCHQAFADHAPEVWLLNERHEAAVLCGACGARLSVAQYLSANATCPLCAAAFNPGCASHHHLYFEMG